MPLSYYGAPIYSSYSNPYSLGPYANHSSIIAANYARSPSSSYTKPLTRIRSSFTPFLATISEAHAASRPMTRITSPKLVLHSSPKFKMPRPISINTADIDVSVNKYRKFKQITRAPDKSEYKKEPENISTPSSTIETESEEHIPGKFPIKRDRALVRLHTIHRRSKDKPLDKEKNNQPKFTRKWRDAFDDEQKPQKIEKKVERSPAERLLEKHLIKDKTEEEEKLRLIEEQKNKRNRNLQKHTEENKELIIRKSPSFHDICESISLDNITEDLNPGQPEHIKRRQTRKLSTEDILNHVRKNSAEFINDNVIIDKLGMKECLDKPNEDSDLSAKNREDTRTSVKRKKKIVRKKTNENLDVDSTDPTTKPMLQRRPTLKKIKRTSTDRNLPLTLELDEKSNEDYQNAIRDISQVEVEEIKVKPKPKPVITSTVNVESTKSNLKAIIVDDVYIEEIPTVKSPKFKLEFTIHNIEDNIDQDQSASLNKNEKLKKLPTGATESNEIKSEIESKQIVGVRTDPHTKSKEEVTTFNKTKKLVSKKIEEKPKSDEKSIKSLDSPMKELNAINAVTTKSDSAEIEKKEKLKSVDLVSKKEESTIVDKLTNKEETTKTDKKPTNLILNEKKIESFKIAEKPVDDRNIQNQLSKTKDEKKIEESKNKPIANETLKDVNVSSKSKPLQKEEIQPPLLDNIKDLPNDKSQNKTPNLEKIQNDILKNKYKQLEIANQINIIKQEIEKKRKKSDPQMTEISTNDAMQIPQTTRPVISKVVTKKHTARMGDILEDINAPPPRKVKQKIIPKNENTEKVSTKKNTSAIEKSSSTDSVNFWDQIGTRETIQFKNRRVIERSIEADIVPEIKESQDYETGSILTSKSQIPDITKKPKEDIKIFDTAKKTKEEIQTENQINDTVKKIKKDIKTESKISDTAKKIKEEIKTESKIPDIAKEIKEEIKTESRITDTAKEIKEIKTESQISDTAKEIKEEIKAKSKISDTAKEIKEEIKTDSQISDTPKEIKEEIKAKSKISDTPKEIKEEIKAKSKISDTAKEIKEEIKAERKISDTAKKIKEEIKTESKISDTAKKIKEEIKAERKISDTAKEIKEEIKAESQISDTAKEIKEEIETESQISDTAKESKKEIKTVEEIPFKVTSKRSLVVKPKVNDPDLQVFVPPEEEPEPEPSEQASEEGKFVPLQSNRLSDWMHPFQKPVQLEVCPIEIYARPKIIRGRHYPRPKHPLPPSALTSKDDSSDSDSSDSEESSEEESDSSQDETNASSTQTGTSTSSNDSGFDSSAPGSPSNRRYDHDCDVNCHKKCEKLTANLCGVNQKLIVEAIASVRKGSSENRDSPSSNPALNPAFAVDSGDTISEDILQSCTFTGYQKSGRITPPATTMPRFRKYTIDDFQFLKVLGKGSFGKVMLAELKNTEYYYAVKCLKKDVVLEDDDVECTLIERKVLALGTKHPYLCHLLCTFQTESHLFFIMEYLNGGDLMFHIQQSGRFAESRAKFYAAEIASGLRFLHSKGIVYRDLKLDNILLDFDGHVRIADFGMCKLQIFLDRTADTFCGTPDYMAPEIIKGQHYNQCVDWWSYGVLLYEMLIGQSPFSGCDEDELFWSICNEKPVIPRFLSTEANAILLLFLEKDAGKRLGNRMCPAGIIQDQPFFKAIDWDRLEARLLEPPFKPKLQHPLDTQYFDKTFTVEKAKLTPIEKNILQSMDQTQFQGFSYTNPNATDK